MNVSDRDDLLSLADRVRRLVPSHREPTRFHEEKSEIEAALRRLAREHEHGEVALQHA